MVGAHVSHSSTSQITSIISSPKHSDMATAGASLTDPPAFHGQRSSASDHFGRFICFSASRYHLLHLFMRLRRFQFLVRTVMSTLLFFEEHTAFGWASFTWSTVLGGICAFTCNTRAHRRPVVTPPTNVLYFYGLLMLYSEPFLVTTAFTAEQPQSSARSSDRVDD